LQQIYYLQVEGHGAFDATFGAQAENPLMYLQISCKVNEIYMNISISLKLLAYGNVFK